MTIAEEIAQIYPESAGGSKKRHRTSHGNTERSVEIARACDKVLAHGRDRDGVIFLSRFNPTREPPDLLWLRREHEADMQGIAAHRPHFQRGATEPPPALPETPPGTVPVMAQIIDPDGRTRYASVALRRPEGETTHQTLMQLLQGEVMHANRMPPSAVLHGTEQLTYQSRSPHGIAELRENLNQWLAGQGITYDAAAASPHFVCANSVNSTLLPNLFRMRKTGGIFSDKGSARQNEIACFTPVYGLLPFNAYEAGLGVTFHKTSKANHYKPTADDIKLALKNRKTPDRLRAIALVNPANPTGACFSKEEIKAIADVVDAHNKERAARGVPPVLVIVDETFRNLMWDREEKTKFYPFAKNKELRPYTISLNTFSKDIGPGIGFAFAYGPPELMKEIAAFDGPSHETQLYAAEV
jgi:hypothetical protein